MHFRQVGADGGNHFFTNKPQADDEGDAEGNHHHRRNGGGGADFAGAQYVHNRGKRADGIGDVVGTVAEGEAGGGKYLHPAKHQESGFAQVFALQGFGIDKGSQPNTGTDHTNHQKAVEGAHAQIQIL